MVVTGSRNLYVQSIRGLCIVLVVLIHLPLAQDSNDSRFLWLSIRKCINFPVAVFFFLSAFYTSSYSKIIELGLLNFYRKRFVRLLSPYFFWALVYLFLIPLITEGTLSPKTFYLFFTGYGPSYFLLSLFQFTLLTPLLQRFKSKKWLGVVCLFSTLVYLVIYYIFNITHGYEFKPELVLCFPWFVFYYIGLKCQDLNFLNLVKKQKLDLVFLCLIVTLIFAQVEGFVLLKKYNIYSFAISQISFGSVLFSCSVIFFLIRISPLNSEVSFLSKLGNYSMGIFMTHPFFIWIFKYIFIHLLSGSCLSYGTFYGFLFAHCSILCLSILSSYWFCKLISLRYPKYSLYLGLK